MSHKIGDIHRNRTARGMRSASVARRTIIIYILHAIFIVMHEAYRNFGIG